MATNTEGERALADLEAGKFSFPMVDSIRDHVNQLDAELQRVRTELQRVNSLHEGAVNQLRQQEFTILRLEGELRKLNARLYALLKANVLTEAALRETKRGAVKFVEFLPVARKHAEESSKAALAYLSTIDLQAKVEAVKAHPLTEKTLAGLANSRSAGRVDEAEDASTDDKGYQRAAVGPSQGQGQSAGRAEADRRAR